MIAMLIKVVGDKIKSISPTDIPYLPYFSFIAAEWVFWTDSGPDDPRRAHASNDTRGGGTSGDHAGGRTAHRGGGGKGGQGCLSWFSFLWVIVIR